MGAGKLLLIFRPHPPLRWRFAADSVRVYIDGVVVEPSTEGKSYSQDRRDMLSLFNKTCKFQSWSGFDLVMGGEHTFFYILSIRCSAGASQRIALESISIILYLSVPMAGPHR